MIPQAKAAALFAAGAVAFELAAFQASPGPVAWLVDNSGLFIAIAGGLVGYGALRQRQEVSERDRTELRAQVDALRDEKADRREIEPLQRQMDRIERAIEALNDRIDHLLQQLP